MAEFVIETADGERLRYETDGATLLRGDGTPIDLSRFEIDYEQRDLGTPQQPFDPEHPVIGKRSDPRILKIQLGLGCNYSCSYCSQGGQKEEATSTRDAEEFSLDWAYGTPDKVELWGGEPLLYWKKILALVPKIKERFGPAVRLSIVSNGSLLTRDKIDWLHAQGFSMALSHDGPGQSLRGDDPLDDMDMRALWRYAFEKFGDRIAINTVITPLNADMLRTVFWFEERLGQVKVNIEDVVTDYGGAQIDDAQLDEIHAGVLAHASSGLAMIFPRVRWSMLQFMLTLAHKKPLMGASQVCGMDRADELAVDLNGKVLTCQNAGAASGHTIGTVADLTAVRLDTATSYMRRPHCHECPVVHLCYGSCMFLQGKDFDSSCRAAYSYNTALIKGAIKLLTGKDVVEIDGWKPDRQRRVIPIKVAT